MVLVGKSDGKKPFVRRWRQWKGNIRIDFQETGWGAQTGLISLRIMTSGLL